MFAVLVQMTFVFLPKNVNAQVQAGAGGNVSTGFNAGGIAGTALVCSGVADKMAGLLNEVIGWIVPTTVPTNDPANDVRENCLRMVTKQIINMLLDKITLSTVNWINGGFEGSPLWLEDPEQFFGDIARNEINSVTGWFTCNGASSCEDYPFGRLVMESILTGLQNQAQANLRFSLNQVLAHGTYEQFRYDFSVGGWAGYTAFLEPQNNPFGNYLLANEEIGRRIGGTSVVTARNFREELSTSGGFLSPRVCVVSGSGNDDYIAESGPGSDMHLGSFYSVLPTGATLGDVTFAQLPPAVQAYLSGFSDPIEQASEYNFIVLRSQCRQWRTTTPGQVVGTRLTTALDISSDSLIAADDFAENIGLIFDALINQLVSQVNGGLRGLSSDNPNSVLLAQVSGQQPGAVNNGQAQGPATDIILGTGATNLPLVDVQNQYITNAQSATALLDELMKKIRALDYCVPGPNPRWVDTAETNFQQMLSSTTPAPVSLPIDDSQTYYRNLIINLVGATIVESPAMYNHSQFQSFMQELWNRYRTRMLASYSPNLAPPTSRLFLTSLFNDLEIYNFEYNDLTDYLANISSVMPTVIQIQASLEAIAAANNGQLNPSDPNVQAQVSIFNSISDHLATESQLSTLVARQNAYQAQIVVLNGHLNACVAETVTGTYNYPNSRKSYPNPIFPWAGLPNPTSGNTFLPNVNFGSGSGDINIEINGVQVVAPSGGLSTFESILQSVY